MVTVCRLGGNIGELQVFRWPQFPFFFYGLFAQDIFCLINVLQFFNLLELLGTYDSVHLRINSYVH